MNLQQMRVFVWIMSVDAGVVLAILIYLDYFAFAWVSICECGVIL